MYSQFKEFVNTKKTEELKNLIEKADTAELSSIILPRVANSDAPTILDQLLSHFSTSEASQSKHRKLVEAILKTLRTAKVSTSHVNALLSRIIQDFPKYSKLQLSKIVEYSLNSLRLNDDEFFCWREILPITLQILEDEKYINYKGNEVTGSEYKSLIIQSICNQPWDLGTLTSLAKMFGEMRMDKNDHGLVIRALCDKMSDVDHKEMPPFVHQVLRLSDNMDGRLVIGTLQKYFERLYAGVDEESPDTVESIGQVSLREIQDTESTVLYHIRQSALLNHSSLKDFVKNLKNVTNAPEFILEPFPMSVLLMISDIYNDQIFEIVKQALVRKIQDDERRKNSFWVKDVLPDSSVVMDIMSQIIENSNKDRHLVLKGLLDLAFVLMDTGKAKDGEENLLHDVGVKILQKLMKKRHEIVPIVLQNLTDKIVAGGIAISHYIECLAYMCRRATFMVNQSQIPVSNLLEQLLAIPGEAAIQVLYATVPLIRTSSAIRDSLVLILRKALYRKGVETRKMAVTGFLQFLSNLKIAPFSLSQSSSSMTNGSNSSIFTQATMERGSQGKNSRSHSAFCQEILIILTKCFSHEAEVRQHLYKGLHEAVAANSELAEAAIDLLLTHFIDFYESDDAIKPPMKLEDCSSIAGPEALLQEPMGHLIFSLQQIYCKVANKNLESLDRLSNVLESLCKRMIPSALDDLQVDDRPDLLDNIPKSQQRVNSIKLSVTCLEALIAYRFGSWSSDNETVAQNVYNLFKSYNEILEFCKSVNKPAKQKKDKGKKDKDHDTTIKRGPKGGIKLPPTILNIEIIYKMLSLLHDPNVPWATREQANHLKKRPDFHNYCLHTCIQIFQSAKALRNVERLKHRDTHEKDYLKIGELLYKNIVCDLDRVREFDEETAVLGLEAFKEYCDVMCTLFNADLSKFLGEMCAPSPSEGLSAQFNTLVCSLQVLIDSYYEEDNEGVTNKIPLILVETVALLLNKVGVSAGSFGSTFQWLKKMSKAENVDTQIALIILQLITIIEDREVDYGKILDEMCVDLCKKLGNIDDNDITVKESYSILTEASMTQAHSIFNNSLKNKLTNASWVLGRLKAEQVVASSPGIGDENFREKLKEKEKSLCRQLSYVIQTLHTLANANVDPGPNTDLTFKNLHQLYGVLNNLTKYFSSKSTQQNPAFEAVKFIQVVQLAGKPLKASFYNLVTHTEEKQNSGRKADAHAQKNKVLKETKFIPKVVYEIEQFNKEILALGKKTRVPLESYIKHSITRDFRIKHPQLVEGLERLDPSQMITMTQNTTRHNETQDHLDLPDDDSSVPEENYAPPPKKPKREVSP
ncbi:Fanconi anemia group I protein [Diachasma alloeum]|uniref:Fanconi anemia group I protein n=1 Tax=Diachasma alloeum TaxID=454923 RepID=UPI0007383099|nr:Fanconi anemia group I protein [Diachasma alloeum]